MKNKAFTAGSLAALLLAGGLGAAGAKDSKMSDSWITAKTKMSLAADGRVKGRQVSVETDNGLVLLRGKVDTAQAKAAAEQIASGIDDVKGVRNELQVVKPSVRHEVAQSDDAITKRVKHTLSTEKALRKADISVKVNDGVVSLSGEAPDFLTSARASWDAWKVDGVRSVKNDLQIKDTARGY
jgi:osmotically-inducible protein OsmY